MGTSVLEGRRTTQSDDEVTVFLIGMRFNRWTAIAQWWPVVTAMPRMLRHLEEHPESGMLGWHAWAGRTPVVLSYWRSPQDLQRFAADRDAPHLEPWRRFMRQGRSDAAVGIWHETYVSRAGTREAIYVDMPDFGLGKAIGSVPVGAGAHTARQRLATPPEGAPHPR